MPAAGPQGHHRGAVQGAEHVQQLGGHRRGRRNRQGAGHAGACRGSGAQHPVQPDTAQARQRPDVSAGGARASRGCRRRRRLLRAPRPAGRGGGGRIILTAKRIRRRHLRGRRVARRDQPAGNRSGQHGTGAGRAAACHRGGRHRPWRPACSLVRHGGGARTGGPGAHCGLSGQQVSRRPGTARARADATRRIDRQAHLRRHPLR